MSKSYDKFIELAIQTLPEKPADFHFLKKRLCKLLALPMPSNADLRENYEKMLKQGQIKKSPEFEATLKTRNVRTQSGVAIVAVLTKPYACPGKCLYCPTEKEMPKSYLSNEPAVMRAISSRFNPYLQVQNRLRSLELNGHNTDKVELIVMGGTFSYFPKSYQKWFITECFRACNDYKFIKTSKLKSAKTNLLGEQKRNEKAKNRIVGLTLETRPDYIDEKEILNFRKLGCTRVELGVQSVFDDVLNRNKRGHDIQKTIEATKLLKDAGFKINYHVMPGLPGSDPERDYEMFEKLFSDQNFQPDMLKIYPTVVIKNSALYNIWKKGEYHPYSDEEFEKFIIEVKNKLIPPYVRIARLVRDVPATSIEAGPVVSNLRQLIARKAHCPCIRCREVKGNFSQDEKIILDRIDYGASFGKEIFLQYVSEDKKKLFALLRLRIPSDCNPETAAADFARNEKLYNMIPILKNSAIIREVHTYGKLAEIDKKDKTSPQHIGLGRKLIKEAEKIAKKEFRLKRMTIISGVGVRNYYRKLGYRQKETYMVKLFS